MGREQMTEVEEFEYKSKDEPENNRYPSGRI